MTQDEKSRGFFENSPVTGFDWMGENLKRVLEKEIRRYKLTELSQKPNLITLRQLEDKDDRLE